MKTLKINERDELELKILKERLQNEVTSEQTKAKREQVRGGQYRTSDAERESQHGLDIVSRLVAQL